MYRNILTQWRVRQMGIYLNPGNTAYKEALNSEIYVDKTGMIACLNDVVKTKQKYVCISRPRRFGKSTALSMIRCFFECGGDPAPYFEGAYIREKGGEIWEKGGNTPSSR